MNKKLSIITICYNEPNLEKTCKSIISQTWQDFEWIVVDGGSNDEIQRILDKYKYRMDKFISEPDTGVYNAMNKGIKLASGEYLNFMNAGDSFNNNKVLKNVFENNCKYTSEILYGDMQPINGKTKKITKFPDKVDKFMLAVLALNHQSTFIKKELFEKYGMYDENYKILADIEKWFCFLTNGVKYQHIPFVIANYDMRGISTTNERKVEKDEEDSAIKNKYLTPDELQLAIERFRAPKYTFSEQIFSIKNDYYKKYKIITILGIHIKIKRKQK